LADDVLVTGCRDKVVRTFSVSTGVQTRTLRGHTSPVYAAALSGSMVASGGADKVVKVWALTGEESAECVATLKGHTNYVYGVAVGPDFVASQAGFDSELIVWRAA
jgi:WD40 repeat protein